MGVLTIQRLLVYLALLASAVALVAFARTPADKRWTQRQAEAEAGAEYAEQYTQRERIKLCITGLVIGLALLALLNLWAEPQLQAFSKIAHCQAIFAMNGSAFLLYAFFIGSALIATLFVGLPMAWYGMRILRDGQAPPRGKKVFKPTRICRGRKAVIVGYYNMLPLLLCLALMVYTVIASHAIVAQSKHPNKADSCTKPLAARQTTSPPSASALRRY